jgi:hypothetical protein
MTEALENYRKNQLYEASQIIEKRHIMGSATSGDRTTGNARKPRKGSGPKPGKPQKQRAPETLPRLPRVSPVQFLGPIPQGTPIEALREAVRPYVSEAVANLARLMQSEDAGVSLQASSMLLDRFAGKAVSISVAEVSQLNGNTGDGPRAVERISLGQARMYFSRFLRSDLTPEEREAKLAEKLADMTARGLIALDPLPIEGEARDVSDADPLPSPADADPVPDDTATTA